MNSAKINPNFHEVTTDQEWFRRAETKVIPIFRVNAVIKGTESVRMSLATVPSTLSHYTTHIANTDAPHRKTYLDIEAFRADHAEDIERITKEYEVKRIVQNENGQQLELRIVNETAEEGTIGVMTSWSTDADWKNEQAIVEALALTYPSKKIVFITTPGMGESTKVSKQALNEMLKDGSFGPMAKQMESILKNTDLTFDTLLGVSEGGRIAISLGAELGTDTVVTVDPPGTNEQFIGTFAKRFGLDEAEGQKQVMKHTPDTEMAKAHNEIDSKLLAKQGLTALKRNLFARAQVMAKAGLESDVRASAERGCKIVDYRASGSTFADASVAAEIAKKIEGYNAVVLKDAPHSITEGSPYATVALLNQAYFLLESTRR